MSGAAAVSAAKNRRSRSDIANGNKTQQQQQQQTQHQQQQSIQEKVELTPIQALHQHNHRIKQIESLMKGLLNSKTEDKKNDNMLETIELFNERIVSLEKYIDEDLSKTLNMKEKEDKEGEDLIYGKINSLETLLKEMKTELIRIQSSTRETSVSFLRHKSETESQLSKLNNAVTLAIESAKASQELASKCISCTCSKTESLPEEVSVEVDTTITTTSIAGLTTNGC
jgi:hypothetical protein